MEFDWESSHPGNLTVDENGFVTLETAPSGNVTVTFRIRGTAHSTTMQIGMAAEVTSLTINETAPFVMEVGAASETLQLTANVVTGGLGTPVTDVIWTSSDIHVATVDQNGLVTAIDSGTATIRVTSAVNSAMFDEIVINGLDPLAAPAGMTRLNITVVDNALTANRIERMHIYTHTDLFNVTGGGGGTLGAQFSNPGWNDSITSWAAAAASKTRNMLIGETPHDMASITFHFGSANWNRDNQITIDLTQHQRRIVNVTITYAADGSFTLQYD
jgi:hypothetical protein